LAKRYDEAFSELPFLKVPKRSQFSTHVFHQYTLLTEGIDRESLKKHLEGAQVPAMIYYPVPLHMQKAYTSERYSEGAFPVTEDLCARVISLPMHTEMQEDQLQHIIETVCNYKH
jgi:dTDP-4-amino-4,6-dideoxygalactose transaminase